MFDYRLIDALDAILREGGFERAAQALHLTQSAVSQRLRQLEEQLGQRLLVRSHPPRATPAAEALLQHVRQVKALEADLNQRLQRDSQAQRPRVSIGINADSLAIWGEALYRTWQSDGDLLVDFVVDLEEATLNLLKQGEVMACIALQSEALPGCSVSALGSMRYHLVATPGFVQRHLPKGLQPHAITQAPALLYNRRDRMLPDYLTRHGLWQGGSLPTLCVPSSQDYAAFALAGHGYGIVPEAQCKAALADGRLVNLLPGQPLDIPLHWHTWSVKTPLLRRLRQGAQSLASTLLIPPA